MTGPINNEIAGPGGGGGGTIESFENLVPDDQWTERLYLGDPAGYHIFDRFLKEPGLFTDERFIRGRFVDVIDFRWPEEEGWEHLTRSWIRNIEICPGGIFEFTYVTDDGMRFYINNELITPYTPTENSWKDQGVTQYKARVVLDKGVYQFRVEHFNHKGPSRASFAWRNLTPSNDTCAGDGGGNPPPAPELTLKDVLVAFPETITKSYVKNSMIAPERKEIILRNTSGIITINVSIEGIPGLLFTPQSMILLPQQEQAVIVEADPIELEQLPEGLNRSIAVFHVSARFINTSPDIGVVDP